MTALNSLKDLNLPPSVTLLDVIMAVGFIDALPEAEFAEYCQTKGITPGQVREWKKLGLEQMDFVTAAEYEEISKKADKINQDLEAAQRQLKSLRSQARKKDKQLAKKKAMLALSEKANALLAKR